MNQQSLWNPTGKMSTRRVRRSPRLPIATRMLLPVVADEVEGDVVDEVAQEDAAPGERAEEEELLAAAKVEAVAEDGAKGAVSLRSERNRLLLHPLRMERTPARTLGFRAFRLQLNLRLFMGRGAKLLLLLLQLWNPSQPHNLRLTLLNPKKNQLI